MKLSDAARVARQAHRGQLYGDIPFIGHVRDVVSRVLEDPKATNDAIVAAYLHDVLEETNLSIHDLKSQGMNATQQEAVVLLTRPDGLDYETYIERVCTNRMAALVKLHDIESNLASNPSIHAEARYRVALPKVTDARQGVTRCKACKVHIVYLPTARGGFMPVDRDSVPATFDIDTLTFKPALGHRTHHRHCPGAGIDT